MQYVWIVVLVIVYVAWIIRSIVDLVIMIKEIRGGYKIDHGAWFVIYIGAHLLALFFYSAVLWRLNH